jgi:hypothetical protein
MYIKDKLDSAFDVVFFLFEGWWRYYLPHPSNKRRNTEYKIHLDILKYVQLAFNLHVL